jgi:hypothetical protein
MGLVQPILDREITFSPLLTTWLQQTYNDRNRFDTLTVGKAKTIAAELISADYKSGKFQTFYVDKIRGATIGESATRTYDSMMQTQMVVDRNSISRAEVYFRRYADQCEGSGIPTPAAWFDRFSIQDSVDIEKPVTVCVRKNISDQETTCADLTSNGAYVLPRNPDQFWFTATVHKNYKPESCSSFDFAIGVSCVVSVEYTDINGFKVKTPVLVNHEKREEYAPEGINEIVECAGEYYRPRN